MKIFVFDTETTGFINKKETNLEKQPKIVQFAGILGEIKDGEYSEIKRVNILINPGIPIPYNSSQVHHIYDIDVKNSPKIEEVIEEIITLINEPDLIIGHNIEFDEQMLKIELDRLKRGFDYKVKNTFCTMKETVDYCAIKGNGERFKYPKLGELHKKLFGKYFVGAHDAMVDVEATLSCFLKLKKEGIVEIETKTNNLISLF